MKISKEAATSLVDLMHDLFFGPRRRRNYIQGLALARLLAIKGVPIACRYLANAYDNGIGTKRNAREAFKAWKEGAILGDVECQAFLAFAYSDGLGTRKSDRLAAHWDLVAARCGHGTSQYNLG